MHSFRQSRPIPSRLRPGVTSDHRYSTSAPAGNMSAQPFNYNYNDNLSTFEQLDGFGCQDPRLLACSEPLVRHLSSDQSSLASSLPASPLMSNNFNSFYTLQASSPGSPMFSQLQDVPAASVGSPFSTQSVSTGYDGNSPPRTVSDDFPSESSKGRDSPVVCLFPQCDAKPFKRRADLDRHYKHKHAPASQKDAYYCDYPKCTRCREPFHRRDHFRDHLREFHKEDIEKRGGSVNEEWLDGRNMSSTWWRCAKCLVRNYVERSGYECPVCKTTCQTKRKELRMRD